EELAIPPQETARLPDRPRTARRLERRRLRLKGVAVALNRSNDSRPVGVVAQGHAKLADQIGEGSIRHEGLRPQGAVDRLLRNGVGPFANQQFQKLKRLGREGRNRAGAMELAGAQVQNDLSELQSHATWRIPRNRVSRPEDFAPLVWPS